jgi:NDP-sugar pyrophosphorylase family protein
MAESMPRRAAILSGGRATRLHGVVDDTPKCLIPIQGTPFVYYQLETLRSQGVTDVVLLLGYMSERVIAAVGDGTQAGLRVTYSVEPQPMGTAGAVKHAEQLLSEPFFLLNGDTMVDVDLAALSSTHAAHPEAWSTLSLCEMDDIGDYGSVDVDESGRVQRFREKRAERRPGLVNAGVYLFEPAVLDYIPHGVAYSVETELMPALLAADRPLYGHRFRGEFVDIGTPERLVWAQSHPLFSSDTFRSG